MSDRRTHTIAPRALPGRARATRKAQHRRARLAVLLWATSPGWPRPLLVSEPRRIPGLEVAKPSNISLTPPSSRLDLPPVPPRQRPRDPTVTSRPPTQPQAPPSPIVLFAAGTALAPCRPPTT